MFFGLCLILFWKRKTINGALLELDNERSKQNLSWSEFSFVVSNLVDEDTAHITADFLRQHVSSLKRQRKKIKYK